MDEIMVVKQQIENAKRMYGEMVNAGLTEAAQDWVEHLGLLVVKLTALEGLKALQTA